MKKYIHLTPYFIFIIFSLISIGQYPLLGDNSQRNLTSKEIRWPVIVPNEPVYYSPNSYEFETKGKTGFFNSEIQPQKYFMLDGYIFPILSFARTSGLPFNIVKVLNLIIDLKTSIIIFNILIGLISLFIAQKIFLHFFNITTPLVLIPFSVSPNFILNYGPFLAEKVLLPILLLFTLFYFCPNIKNKFLALFILFWGILSKVVFTWFFIIVSLFDIKKSKIYIKPLLYVGIPLGFIYILIVPFYDLLNEVFLSIDYVKPFTNWVFGFGAIKNIILSPRLLNTLFFEEVNLPVLSLTSSIREVLRFDLFTILHSITIIFIFKKNKRLFKVFIKTFLLTILLVSMVIIQGQNDLNMEQQTFAIANFFPLFFSYALYKININALKSYASFFIFASLAWCIEFTEKKPPPEINLTQYEQLTKELLKQPTRKIVLFDQEDTGFFEVLSKDKLDVYFVGIETIKNNFYRLADVIPKGKSIGVIREKSTWSEYRKYWPFEIFHNHKHYETIKNIQPLLNLIRFREIEIIKYKKLNIDNTNYFILYFSN